MVAAEVATLEATGLVQMTAVTQVQDRIIRMQTWSRRSIKIVDSHPLQAETMEVDISL
jgi:hypothetical protein